MTKTIGEDDLVEYGFRRIIITITAVLCALLEIVDTTIVNVALTNMRGSLGATLNDVAWVITAYAIANVIVIPMTSWLSQQFGRKNYFAVSIIIFKVDSFPFSKILLESSRYKLEAFKLKGKIRVIKSNILKKFFIFIN